MNNLLSKNITNQKIILRFLKEENLMNLGTILNYNGTQPYYSNQSLNNPTLRFFDANIVWDKTVEGYDFWLLISLKFVLFCLNNYKQKFSLNGFTESFNSLKHRGFENGANEIEGQKLKDEITKLIYDMGGHK